MSCKILIIDDSPFILKSMVKIIEAMGHQVQTAKDGNDGIQKAGAWNPDLVFVDLLMPKLDGFQATKYMREHFAFLKIVAISSQPALQAQDELIRLGANEYVQKPLTQQKIAEILSNYFDKKTLNAAASRDEIEEVLTGDPTQPYDVQIKKCPICAYDQVKLFVPKKDAFEEDWTHGLYPHYHAKGEFQEWDFIKTFVTVCPSCLFASIDSKDFHHKNSKEPFQYKLDAKKILALGISSRKKIVGRDADEFILQFDNPNRSLTQVINSYTLAEKCANGLVLGDKESAYFEVGFCRLMLAVLQKDQFAHMSQEALNIFIDQLKTPSIPPGLIAKTYYFIIALHLALEQSLAANDKKMELEQFYAERDTSTIEDEERIWNQRLLHIWREGMPRKLLRGLQ